MVAHYLRGLGWSVKAWEPPSDPGVDVDLLMSTPNRTPVSIQVKAPDQPGRIEDYHVVDGEFDERIVDAVEKAGTQLSTNAGSNLVFICANRQRTLASEPSCVVTHLVGSSVYCEGRVSIPLDRRGRFFDADWEAVGGVAVLDLNRGLTRLLYSCSVLTNPAASKMARSDWFPRARVAVLEGRVFRWVRGEPTAEHTLPTGTLLEGWPEAEHAPTT